MKKIILWAILLLIQNEIFAAAAIRYDPGNNTVYKTEEVTHLSLERIYKVCLDNGDYLTCSKTIKGLLPGRIECKLSHYEILCVGGMMDGVMREKYINNRKQCKKLYYDLERKFEAQQKENAKKEEKS